jgi:hypothetical protein
LRSLQQRSAILDREDEEREGAMRPGKRERLEAIWRAVERQPGVRAGRVAGELGLARTSVMRALPAMEEAGLLLSEDAQGRLWPWTRHDPDHPHDAQLLLGCEAPSLRQRHDLRIRYLSSFIPIARHHSLSSARPILP